MRQGEDGRSSTHIGWNLHREVLVVPIGVSGGREGTSVKDVAEPVCRLRANSIVAAGRREGNADFGATDWGILEPIISVNRYMVDLMLSAHRPVDSSGEDLS